MSEYLGIVEKSEPELCDSPLVESLDFCLGQLAALQEILLRLVSEQKVFILKRLCHEMDIFLKRTKTLNLYFLCMCADGFPNFCYLVDEADSQWHRVDRMAQSRQSAKLFLL